MSNLDLAGAIHAATYALHPIPEEEEAFREAWDQAKVAVTAAAPLIERQIRERIAAELKTVMYRSDMVRAEAGLEVAIDIVRGGVA